MTYFRRVTVVVILAFLSASCGLSVDQSPNIISSQDLPRELRLGQLPTPTPQLASLSGPGRDQIHMIRTQTNRLVTVERQIVETPQRVMELLLAGTFPQEAEDGIQSALFRGTRVQNIEVNDLFDVAIVDLAPGSLDPRNSEQRLAFAQIVYSLTSLPGIESVQFVQTDRDDPSAGTVELAVQTDDGTTLPGARVTRADFASLSPNLSPQPAFDLPVVTPTATPDPDAPPMFPVPIWMLNEDNKLVRVSRTIPLTPDAFLVAVIEGALLEERDQGIRSAIPPDALAEPVVVERVQVFTTDESGFEVPNMANLAMVDLNPGSLPSETDGDERLLAAAQIVYTLTELEAVDLVVFSVAGIPIPIITDRGLTTVPRGLSRDDYASTVFQPPAAPTNTPEPTSAPIIEPTPIANAEPTPVAITEPTPIANAEPTATPIPTPTPEPTATPG